jgi:hypothetical protein
MSGHDTAVIGPDTAIETAALRLFESRALDYEATRSTSLRSSAAHRGQPLSTAACRARGDLVMGTRSIVRSRALTSDSHERLTARFADDPAAAESGGTAACAR